MKKINLTLLLVLSMQVATFSQSCLPDGIIFTSQSQIDSFQIDYPNCYEIEGGVRISGDDIIDLNGLQNITHINGRLYIVNCPNLISLAGLSSLTSIGGYLNIDNIPKLANLNGLNSVNSVGSYLAITNNSSLVELNGLENISSLVSLSISNNVLLKDLSSLGGISMIGGPGSSSLYISSNSSLTSLNGLGSITSILGRLVIENNDSLYSLAGLDSLYQVSTIDIEENDDLDNINTLSSVSGGLEGGIYICNNINLKSITGLENITSTSFREGYTCIWRRLTISGR